MASKNNGYRAWVITSLVGSAARRAGCTQTSLHRNKHRRRPYRKRSQPRSAIPPDRPADVERDADRKPAQTLAFFDVKPGQVVFEFVAGGGYFTELLSRTVGRPATSPRRGVAKERIADGRLANVTAVEDSAWGLAPNSVDLAFTALNYHDVVNLKIDRAPLLANILTILKPGGIFAVIDHSAQKRIGRARRRHAASHRRSSGRRGSEGGRIRTRRHQRSAAQSE